MSHDFANNQGTSNIFAHPLDFEADGGEIIFSLPNGMQGYMIVDAAGSRWLAVTGLGPDGNHLWVMEVRPVRLHARGRLHALTGPRRRTYRDACSVMNLREAVALAALVCGCTRHQQAKAQAQAQEPASVPVPVQEQEPEPVPGRITCRIDGSRLETTLSRWAGRPRR
ncbi:hypothetical protein SAMN02745121_08948 [Nannocystis exedens]|uniref:Uncharacterized protein n=1 Tax=Nannocystis exedens TaxID=54 RepID=A0A1I2ISC8_9BACT|nr:hypothetical protein [Nannocystis exedens]PCC69449.1 hypothetical protein NAEX_02471 [Nannocystis exedens]SFF45215.1 hypothetical protein SAMN02745121_08948 [Nannocystis exedens]